MDRGTISFHQLKGIPVHDFCHVYLANNMLCKKSVSRKARRRNSHKNFFDIPFSLKAQDMSENCSLV